MPRPRQRIVTCDCLDCVELDPSTGRPPASSELSERVARQEPPPKCLLVLVTGALQPTPCGKEAADGGDVATALDAATIPHLHRLAKDGNSGLLVVRQRAAQEVPGSDQDAALAEVAQLLGVYADYASDKQPAAAGAWPSLQQRFKGLQAAFASNSAAATALAVRCGAAASPLLDAITSAAAALVPALNGAAAVGTASADGDAAAMLGLPSASAVAAGALAALDLQNSTEGIDMLILHVDVAEAAVCSSAAVATSGSAPAGATSTAAGSGAFEAAVGCVEWVDQLLRHLNNEGYLREAALLAVVLTPTAATLYNSGAPPAVLVPGGGSWLSGVAPADVAAGSAGCGNDERGAFNILRPRQSFQQSGGADLQVDTQRPLLALRRLPGVVRRDLAQRCSVAETAARGGSAAMLADRLLPEIAYKLGRAPKYGA